MTKSVFVTTTERASGKSLIVLGLMELLSHRVGNLGFFRPVIRGGDVPDNDIELVRTHYNLALPYEASYAVTHEEARHLVADGQHDELLKLILTRFKEAQRQCDFMVCEGTDYSGVNSAFEFEFNAEVANHLGCPVILVANGKERTIDQMYSIVAGSHKEFSEQHCPVAATLVNRVQPDLVADAQRVFADRWSGKDPVFLIPEVPTLSTPTIGEIARQLSADVSFGHEEHLNRDAVDYKIAAMELPHFLDHIHDGSLVIVPGDRADIVLGCLATTLSETYPKIAGLVLTGGLEPSEQIQRLILGIQHPPVPILSVDCDTFTTATQINSIRAAITPRNQRRIAVALGAFETHVDVQQFERQIEVSRSVNVTPLMFEYDLIERARTSIQHIVLPEGIEDRILRAAELLRRRDVVNITLLGNEKAIRTRMLALGLDRDGCNIVDPVSSEWKDDFAETYCELRQHRGMTPEVAADTMLDVSYFGTMMVYKDLADGMVSGSIHTTAHTIRPSFEIIKTTPGCSIVSSVMFMCLADRVLVYGDCAINPNPNAEQLADIAISSAATAKMFGVEPRVAMLSYSTGVSGTGQDVEMVRKATEIARKARPDLMIEGPIQYDAAIDASVARTKAPESEVAGRATVFIFPDLNTGNNTYKAVQRSADAVAVGPVLQGLKKPVNDLSRGCTVPDIVNTVAITAIQAQLTP